MANRSKVVSIAEGKATRYKPMVSRGIELISAERCKQLDAEAICERFSERFIRTLRLMDEDRAAVLELLAEGINWSHGEELDRAEAAAVSLKQRRKRRPEGGR